MRNPAFLDIFHFLHYRKAVIRSEYLLYTIKRQVHHAALLAGVTVVPGSSV